MADHDERPKGGFWHCLAVLEGRRDASFAYDMTYERIIEEIVTPHRQNTEFYVNGKVVHSRSRLSDIKIIHSSVPSTSIQRQTYTKPFYGLIKAGAIDYTQKMLRGSFCDVEIVEIVSDQHEPQSSQLPQINVTNHNSASAEATSSSESVVHVHFQEIESLRDELAELKSNLREVVDKKTYNDIAEILDIADNLTQQSSPKDVCTVMTKFKRLIKKAFDTSTTVGSAILKIEGGVESLLKIRDACNKLAIALSLTPI